MIRIGTLDLEYNLLLAPMAGYTNLPFRLTIRELGGLGLATTDLVNARSLLESKAKAFQLIETSPADRPLAIQLFGSVLEEMRDAASLAESMGIESIDINMGCPVPKVCRAGGGSVWMIDVEKSARIAAAMVKAVHVPVTAKMRLGWDARHVNAPDLARLLADAGIAAITVHGRTRDQGFSGVVSLAGIRAVVEAARRIPIIGNGDVTTAQAAAEMIRLTGCRGVSIGRGAFYNPWIFRQTASYLQTGELPSEPGFEDRIQFIGRHLDRMIEVFGETHACRMFRKVAPLYARRLGPAREFNRRMAGIQIRADFDHAIDVYRQWRLQFLDGDGALKPPYQPRPLASSFAGIEASPNPLPVTDGFELPGIGWEAGLLPPSPHTTGRTVPYHGGWNETLVFRHRL